MRLLLADHHKLFRDALTIYLKSMTADTEICGASNFDQALSLASTKDHLDVAVLSIDLPGMNGLGGLETFHDRASGTRTVILADEASPARPNPARLPLTSVPKDAKGAIGRRFFSCDHLPEGGHHRTGDRREAIGEGRVRRGRERADMAQIEIDGRRIDSLWIGPAPGKAPTIILLHEGLGSIAMWRDFPLRLAEATGAGLLLYSRYGYGDSSALEGKRRADYMHLEAKETLPRLIAHFEIEPPFYLFGHSDGASIALIYAGGREPSPAGLILEAPHAFVEEVAIVGIKKAKTLYETTDLPAKLGRYHRDPDNAFWGWNDIWLAPEFRDWNIEAFLPRVSSPALLIQCEGDPYGSTAQLDTIEHQAAGPCERLLLAGDSHAPHHAHPEAVIEATARFLARHR